MTNPFTAHPAAVGQTYGQHLVFALKFGAMMTIGGLAAILHAVFPFLLVTTASRMVDRLNELRTRDARPAAITVR